ncbi:serine/threonine-protein kinase [Nonomuraea sp. NPDC050404]|uniref:serine/threonine-protein kinase n=1 Tax=Nonomuraea sp. NPDC050404 TaxID=3155783 RepID=UPI0033C9DC7C
MHVSNRYRLIEPLGEGGMGVVWRAHDELLDRTVAVKEVRYTGVGDAKRAELNRRTIREARAAGRLDHPSVVVIHDVVEEDGRPWIVMQLVRSRSLAQVVGEGGPLRTGQVAVIGGRLLDALRTAHAAGVLHRDVKPENVLLADDGRVVLTDFGIASMETEAALTATGGLVGTPAYMPPERLNGDPARPESDLWSLGATLYTAVEGRPPFKRDSWAATVAAVLRDEPEPPTRAGTLEPVIMGLLRRDPAARMPAEQAARLLHEAALAPTTPQWTDGGGGLTAMPSQAGGGPQRAAGGLTTDPGVPDSGLYRTASEPVRRSRRALWIGVPAAVAVVAVLGTGGVLLSDRWSAAPLPTGTPTATPTATPTPEPTETPSETPTPTAVPVPDGWKDYRSAPGAFEIAIPERWQIKKHPTRDSVSIQGPGSSGTLIVEWTASDIAWDDPKQHWAALERDIRAKGEFKEYRRIGITSLSYQGVRAADWEFTRVRNGQRIHVINRGFRTAGGRPFALYWEAPAAQWSRDRHYFEKFAETFRPL